MEELPPSSSNVAPDEMFRVLKGRIEDATKSNSTNGGMNLFTKELLKIAEQVTGKPVPADYMSVMTVKPMDLKVVTVNPPTPFPTYLPTNPYVAKASISSLSIGALVGIIIGSISFVGILIGIYFYYFKRNKIGIHPDGVIP